MKITKSEFGTTKNGSIINLFHLENTSGAYVEIIDFGCRLTKIVVPDRNGDPVDVCLGFSTADHYADDDASLGAVVGRVANRIKDGHFSLNGKDTSLPSTTEQIICTAVSSVTLLRSGNRRSKMTN